MTQSTSRRVGVIACVIAVIGLFATTLQQYQLQQQAHRYKMQASAAQKVTACQADYNEAVAAAIRQRADLANQDAANAAADQALNKEDRHNLIVFIDALFKPTPSTPEERAARSKALKEDYDRQEAALERQHDYLTRQTKALQKLRTDIELPHNHC